MAQRSYYRDVVASYATSNCPPRFFGDLYRKHRRAVVLELVRENTTEQLLEASTKTGALAPLVRLALLVHARRAKGRALVDPT
jgi:hypothetical protein